MASRIDREALRERYDNNFFAFVREVLEYRDLRINPHWEVCEFLAKSPGDGSVRSSNVPMYRLKPGPGRRVAKKHKAIFLPRNSFKSTILSASYTLWRWTKNIDLRVLEASYNLKKASEFLAEIKGNLHKPRFRALYGDMGRAKDEREGVWSKLEMQLYDPAAKRYVPFRNMYSAAASGGGMTKAGSHPDLFIGDDLVTDRNTKSKDQIEATKENMKYVESAMGPNTEVMLAGTFYSYLDYYQDVVADPEYDIMLRSAVNPDGSLWFPERLTYEFLKSEEARLGPYEFGCQYLMTPTNPKDAKFKPEWIEDCKYDVCPYRLDQLTVEVWVEPASTTNRYSDNSSILVIGMDPLGCLWLLASIKRRMEPQDLVETMVQTYLKWGATALNCEEQAAFTFIKPMVERAALDKEAVVNYQPFKQTTRESKGYRILALVPLMSGKRIRIQRDMMDVLSEVAHYPHGHDDALDNLASAAARLAPPDVRREITPEYRAQIIKDYQIKQMQVPDPDFGGETPFFTNVFYG